MLSSRSVVRVRWHRVYGVLLAVELWVLIGLGTHIGAHAFA